MRKCTCGCDSFQTFWAEAIHWFVCKACGRWWKDKELKVYAEHGQDWANPATWHPADTL